MTNAGFAARAHAGGMESSSTPPASLVPVAFGRASATHGHLLARTRGSIDDVIAALTRAIAAAQMLVLHAIDPQRILSAHGYQLPPARQLLLFHPRYMARLLAIDPAAIVEAPLKIAVLTDPDTGEVTARMADPRVTFGAYAGLCELGEELAATSERILAAVGGDP